VNYKNYCLLPFAYCLLPKNMRFADLKQLDKEKLKKELVEKQAELEQLRFQIASGALKQVHKVKEVRIAIARIKMILRQK